MDWTIRGRTQRSSLALVAGLLLGSWVAGDAGAGEECSTWLPDFGCEREARYPGFVPPMSSPFLFEDPFITTGIRLWGIWNDLPNQSIFRGGELRAAAAQLRIALTDRLAFVATKDGVVQLRGKLNLLNTKTGLFDLAAGFKYALIDRPDDGFILTPSLRYEASQGTREVFSGNGQGVWIPAVSAGLKLGKVHALGAVGARLPVDGDAESTPVFYNLHLDYPVSPRLVPFLELNGLHYVDDGTGKTPTRLSTGARLSLSQIQTALAASDFDGNDLLNLGSDGVEGNDVITLAIGVQIPLSTRVTLGFSYEHPITRRKDLIQQRFSLSLNLEL